MPRYQVIQAEVEAFRLEDGRMVVVGAGDELRILAAEAFTKLFEAAPDRRAKPERRTKSRAKKAERRKVARATRKVITGQELAESAAVAVRANRNPQRDRAGELWRSGYKVAAISEKTGVNEALLRYWKKADRWPEHEQGPAKRLVAADDSWMQ